MNLGDLMDLDRQLRLDQKAENDEARLKREEQIGRTLRDMRARESDEALLLAWKNNIDREPGPSFGSLFETALRWTALLLAFFGLLLGWGTAAALLRQPSGSETINLVYFFGGIVGVQFLLLPFLLIAFLFRSRLQSDLLFARRIIGAFLGWIFSGFARLLLDREKAADLRADFGNFSAQSSFYRRVQPLLLLFLLQIFSFAFILAAAVTLLFQVLFTELNFSWETTLDSRAEQVHRLTSILSVPWASIAPQARPTLEQIEATQLRTKRHGDAFGESPPFREIDLAGKGTHSRGWWRFLFAATIVYGLLPRLIALVLSAWLLKREIRRSLARSSRLQALKERLRTPVVQVREQPTPSLAPKPKEVRKEERKQKSVKSVAAPIKQGLEYAVLYWAYDERPPEEKVDELLRGRLDASIVVRFDAGQLEESDEEVMEKIATAGAELDFKGAAVFIEPFEPPKADLRRFLGLLRKTLGESLPIVVFLAEFEEGELQPVERGQWEIWDRGIRSLGDPFLLLNEREVRE